MERELPEIKKSIAEAFAQLKKLDSEIEKQTAIINRTPDDSRLKALRLMAEDSAVSAAIGEVAKSELAKHQADLAAEETAHAERTAALEKEKTAARTMLAGLNRRRDALLAEIEQQKSEEKGAITAALRAVADAAASTFVAASDDLARSLATLVAVEELSKSHGHAPIKNFGAWGWGALQIPQLADRFATSKAPISVDMIGVRAQKARADLIAKIS